MKKGGLKNIFIVDIRIGFIYLKIILFLNKEICIVCYISIILYKYNFNIYI